MVGGWQLEALELPGLDVFCIPSGGRLPKT